MYIEQKLREKRAKERSKQIDSKKSDSSSQNKLEEKYHVEDTGVVVGNWQAGIVEYELPLEFICYSFVILLYHIILKSVIRKRIFRKPRKQQRISWH